MILFDGEQPLWFKLNYESIMELGAGEATARGSGKNVGLLAAGAGGRGRAWTGAGVTRLAR